MESEKIPDGKITASSYYDERYLPHYARLRRVGKNCSWEPPYNFNSATWVQVDLGKLAIVTGIATQGNCYTSPTEWAKSYSVSYSKDGNNWKYFEESGGVKVFQANRDKHTIVTNVFKNATQARYLRIWPKTWSYYPALRLEYYGCYL
ncbi:lactadherin-like [Dendronephthya gigantea]|uniref:lactadherin-like n=1 Tax=Dendronephthya gigantea TaxID=151771 RepID=UPI001069EA15|nr:lactadherin-like [Dendronephthya gigantea]